MAGHGHTVAPTRFVDSSPRCRRGAGAPASGAVSRSVVPGTGSQRGSDPSCSGVAAPHPPWRRVRNTATRWSPLLPGCGETPRSPGEPLRACHAALATCGVSVRRGAGEVPGSYGEVAAVVPAARTVRGPPARGVTGDALLWWSARWGCRRCAEAARMCSCRAVRSASRGGVRSCAAAEPKWSTSWQGAVARGGPSTDR